ncbi:MAG: helix-turn-helix domain-containing protein [Akkermansiaceae bacterium]
MVENLGEQLKSARERSGVSVDDAVYIAKIPRDVVLALEEENFGFFSSPLYARSFLQQYANYIGADVDLWLENLVSAPVIDSEGVEALVNRPKPNEKDRTASKKAPAVSGNSYSALWFVVITAGLSWGGYTAFKEFDRKFGNSTPLVPEAPLQVETSDSKENSNLEQNQENLLGGEEESDERPVVGAVPEPPKRAIIVNTPE